MQFNFKFPPWLAGPLLIVAGIGMAIYAKATLGDAKASESWPGVTGQVIYTDVDRVHKMSSTSGSNSSEYRYVPEVQYEYQVEGVTYEGDRIQFGSSRERSRFRAQDVVDRYPITSEVTVYYDPANPSKSVLEPGADLGLTLMPWGGLIFLIGGIATTIGVYFKGRREA